MCGRYYIDEETSIEIKKILNDITNRFNKPKNKTSEVFTKDLAFKTGEVFPTDMAPILVAKNDTIVPEVFKWGAPGFEKSKQIINARSESIFEKRMFKESIIQRRCIIPANGFYEWSHSGVKKKYYFTDLTSDIIYMAGIYDNYQGIDSFVILTTSANQSMAEIHNRMPLTFNRNQMEEWLMDDSKISNLISNVPMQLHKQIKLEENEQLSFDFLK